MPGKPLDQVFLQCPTVTKLRHGEMIAIAEFVKRPAISRKAEDLRRGRVDLIEIEREHEDLVAEVVFLRLEPMVHHVALVKTGAEWLVFTSRVDGSHNSALSLLFGSLHL